jgi:hypothetical protein
MNKTPIEGQNEVLIAHWKTTGKDFLSLYCGSRPGDYFYRGNQCGGGLSATVTTDEEAIRWMEFDRNGAARILKLDRPSLKRVSLSL